MRDSTFSYISDGASNPLRSSSTRHPPLAWIRVEAIAIPGEGAAAAPGGQVGCRHRIIPTIPVTRFLTAQVRHQPNPPSSPLLSSLGVWFSLSSLFPFRFQHLSSLRSCLPADSVQCIPSPGFNLLFCNNNNNIQ